MEQCEKHNLEVCEPCAYDRGARDERERCAVIAQNHCDSVSKMDEECPNVVHEIAAEIRRGVPGVNTE